MASLETGGQTLKNKIPPYICIYIPTNNLFWGLVLRSCDVIEDGRTVVVMMMLMLTSVASNVLMLMMITMLF